MSALSVEVWSGAQLRERMPEAMAVYAQAMGYAPSVADQRGGFAASHSRYPDFECRVSLDGNAVVGIAYGYGSRAGQWWHDAVRRALSAEIARAWLVDAFELSELHVLPSYQGRRLGRLMLESLVAPIPHAAVLLSTPEGPTRAFSLYRNLGFVDLARHHLFAGDSRPFAVLGAQLPLGASLSDASRAGASQPDERGAGRA